MNNNVPVKREPQRAIVQSPSQQALAQLVASNPLLPRIHLALMFPRDLERFEESFRQEVLAAPEGMVYAKPQGKEKLRGPSIRMAEIGARHFRNLWVSEPRIEERDNRVTATVEALDLESNCSQPGTATTSLVGKDRTRLRDDVVSNLVSATVAKAKRNAIIALIGRRPFDDLVADCIAEERRRASGWTPEQIAAEWDKATRWWVTKVKVSVEELLAFCKAESPDKVSAEALVDLKQAATAVQQGTPPRVALGLDDGAEQPRPPGQTEDFFEKE